MNQQIASDQCRTGLHVVRRPGFASLVWIAAVLAASSLVTAGQAFLERAVAAQEGRLRIVAFGDSLTAGYGVGPSESFPVQLEQALRARGHNVEIVNAGVSGDTTAAGLARFDWAIPDDADGVILELGANDALRGLPPSEARTNLDAILKRLAERKLPTLVAGMRAPSNWGASYQAEFDSLFAPLAQQYDAIHYPFFLDGVAMEPDLNQPDGLHPNARGVERIVSRILPSVEALIERARNRPARS